MSKEKNTKTHKTKPSKCGTSVFQIPAASVLAEERKQQSEQEAIVAAIIKNMNSRLNDNFDVDILSNDDYDVKKIEGMISDAANSREQSPDVFDHNVNINVKVSQIRTLNPGIQIDELNLDSLVYEMSESKRKFLKIVLKMIKRCNDDLLEDMLTTLVVEIQDTVTNSCSILSVEDILAYVLLLLIISFEVRCRTVILLINKRKVLWETMKKLPPTSETLTLFTDKILQVFKHFHDRYCVAEFLRCGNFSHIHIDEPMYFSNTLSRYILYHTLCDIIKYKENTGINVENFNTSYNLKKIFRKSNKLNSLDHYEQYFIIKIVYTLKRMMRIEDNIEHLEKEKKAEKWFVYYFSELKPKHSQQKNMNPDFLKVKSLCSSVKLLWTHQQENNVTEKNHC